MMRRRVDCWLMDRINTMGNESEFKNQLIVNNRSLALDLSNKYRREFFDITAHKIYDVQLKMIWITS